MVVGDGGNRTGVLRGRCQQQVGSVPLGHHRRQGDGGEEVMALIVYNVLMMLVWNSHSFFRACLLNLR